MGMQVTKLKKLFFAGPISLGVSAPSSSGHLGGHCPAGRCAALVKYRVTTACTGCTLCAQHCPVRAIPMTPYAKHEINLELCMRCDTCRKIRPRHAIEATSEDLLPRPAIRPYPAQYVAPWTSKNGINVVIRPNRPEDEPLLVKFHQTLSEETVYHRYFNTLQLSERIAHERLVRICFNDYDREIALVAEHKPSLQLDAEILGIGRLRKLRDDNDAEFALVISDAWHRMGLGAEMLKRLVDIGKKEKIRRIIGHILPENHAMQHICRKAGFKVEHDAEGHDFLAAYANS
jgi:RimJ/RimL family protein N-acetyltransferase